jgi:DNA polymerase III epsilon subunit family exonuclease
VQLAFDSADRLVELLEERGAPVAASEALRCVFAIRSAAEGMARSLLEDLVAGDARLSWIGSCVGLARPASDPLLEEAEYVVFDLETTGLGAAARICEIGGVRIASLELADAFQTFVDPRAPLPAEITALTGIEPRHLRGAPSATAAVRGFMRFAGDAYLVAHNARFDRSFLDRDLDRFTGRRLARPVLDTLALARRLLAGRTTRTGLAALAHFFGTAERPCHRALPDSQATAEILLALIGLAQERGARTVGDLYELSAPRQRRVYDKRALANGAPTRPGVYVFRGPADEALYVGRARDLRARLRSYFRSERQRPSVEAALAAVETIEWRILGSELEAGIEELRLIRKLRPPANARQSRPDRYVYLQRRADGIVVSRKLTRLGPIRRPRDAERAAREGLLGLNGPLPRLRSRLRDLSACLRYEDAARLRDGIASLERVTAHLRELERLRALEVCIIAPAVEPHYRRAFFVRGGRLQTVRTVPPGAGAAVELQAGAVLAQNGEPATDPDCVDELLLIGSFLRHPTPELETVPLSACAGARRAA